MTAVPVSPAWLALREPADAAARAPDLVGELRRNLPDGRRLVVHDLGCGTGSMLRWLAPELPAPQHWICHDLDPGLLRIATSASAPPTAEMATVTLEARRNDVTRLQADTFANAAFITASALLDLLTADEMVRLVADCADGRCPVLLTLSVIGRVRLWPPHPFDDAVGAAFNSHQRRAVNGRRLLGPDAVDAAAADFGRRGYGVRLRASPWRLGAADRALIEQWFSGWLSAACEQQPELTAPAREYERLRRAQAAAGRLRVLVYHRDLLALPPGRRRGALNGAVPRTRRCPETRSDAGARGRGAVDG